YVAPYGDDLATSVQDLNAILIRLEREKKDPKSDPDYLKQFSKIELQKKEFLELSKYFNPNVLPICQNCNNLAGQLEDIAADCTEKKNTNPLTDDEYKKVYRNFVDIRSKLYALGSIIPEIKSSQPLKQDTNYLEYVSKYGQDLVKSMQNLQEILLKLNKENK